jgi:hypothetical protein
MHSTNLTTTAPTEIELSRRSQCQDNDLSSRDEEGQILTDTVTYPVLSRWKTVTIISTVSGITVLNSMQNGIVTVGLPTIGRDLGLNPSLILWYVFPSSFFTLFPGKCVPGVSRLWSLYFHLSVSHLSAYPSQPASLFQSHSITSLTPGPPQSTP